MTPTFKIYGSGILIFILFFSGITISSSFRNQQKDSSPNIIIILVDDAGFADFGFMGSKDLQTPNLDAVAAQGIRFTDAHVTATVCSPSRAGLLTGKYQQRFGYECNEGDGYPGLDTTLVLLPGILQQQGYATAAIGKWHLGYEPSQHPLKRGFQYYYGFLSGGRSYFYRPEKDDRAGSRNAMVENNQQVSFDGYLTDVLAQKATAYIRQHKDQPFFMYWAPNAVHTPLEASKEDLERFAGHPRQKLAAMTLSLDRAVGNIIDELKLQGIFENTLIFFLSDNGGAHNNQSSNFPLKGFKGNKYEAGHRVPFFMSWPLKFTGNVTFRGITSSLDIFPTALEAAGVKNIISYNLDGNCLLPFLKNKKQQHPHQQLVWRKDKAASIRSGKYKLILIQNAGDRLYDLEKDPGETKDLVVELPDVYNRLKRQYILWEKDKVPPLWTEGALWDTITLMIHDDLMQNRKVRVSNPEELKEFQLKK